MCGIAGILGEALPPAARRERLTAMLGTIDHRGPDGWGTYVDGQVGLGHVRLAIIDLADGNQPFVEGAQALSFSGEIFNHVELRRELEALGEQFRTKSDTEVLLRAMRRWGLDALPRLDGQFAFLYWDATTRQLVAARDRYGILPLYHLVHEGAVHFASELKAFDVLPGYERRLSPGEVLEHGLLWNTLGDRTVYQGIASVEAGSCLVLAAGHPARKVRYYRLGEGTREPVPASFEEAKAVLREKLTTSIEIGRAHV